MYSIILSIFQLVRIKNVIISIVAILFFSNSLLDYNTFNLVCCIVIVVSYLIGGNIINDYYDYNIDLINKPQSPLVNHFISLQIAYKIGFSLLIFSFILSLIFSIYAILISLLTFIILLVYTTQLKNTPLIGNIVISLLVGLIFVFTELVLTNQLLNSLPCFILSFILNFCREIIKDMEDIEGDKINNISTFPVVFGFQFSKYLLIFSILLFIAISLSPIISQYFTTMYFILLLFVHIPLFYIIILLFDDLTSKGCRRVSNLIKMIYAYGLLVILFSLK